MSVSYWNIVEMAVGGSDKVLFLFGTEGKVIPFKSKIGQEATISANLALRWTHWSGPGEISMHAK